MLQLHHERRVGGQEACPGLHMAPRKGHVDVLELTPSSYFPWIESQQTTSAIETRLSSHLPPRP